MSTGAVQVHLGSSSLIPSQALNQGFMHRILFITYEHAIRTFSGNGVYATSQTSALAGLGHHVVVLSAYPDDFELRNDDNNTIRVRFFHYSRIMPSVFHAMCCVPCSAGCVLQVPVPSSSWGTLHNTCAWKAFSDGAASDCVLQSLVDPTTGRVDFDIVLTVDWHAALAWQRILESLQPSGVVWKPRWVFLSYRMFSRDEASSEVCNCICPRVRPVHIHSATFMRHRSETYCPQYASKGHIYGPVLVEIELQYRKRELSLIHI